MLRRALFLILLIASSALAWAQAAPSLDEGPNSPGADVAVRPKPPAQQDPRDGASGAVLTNDTIIRMTKAGLSEGIIEQAVQMQPGQYDTRADDLIALKQAGVADHVISLMMAHGTGLTTRSAVRAETGARPGSVDVAGLSPGLDEMGVYYRDRTGDWVPLKSERVTIKSGGWLKSAATHNIVKEDRNGTVEGEHSPLVLGAGTQLMIYAPEGTDATEYTFVQFREHGNRREFRVYTGGVFHGQSGSDRDAIEFTAKKVAPRMYSFNVPGDIVVGEYGVLPPGSAGAPSLNGNGKMFTFRITEANATKKP